MQTCRTSSLPTSLPLWIDKYSIKVGLCIPEKYKLPVVPSYLETELDFIIAQAPVHITPSSKLLKLVAEVTQFEKLGERISCVDIKPNTSLKIIEPDLCSGKLQFFRVLPDKVVFSFELGEVLKNPLGNYTAKDNIFVQLYR